MEAGFEITLKEDGVFLRVSSAKVGSLPEVAAALKELSVSDYNGEAVKKALDDQLDEPILIAPPIEAKDADFRIRIAEDSLVCDVWLIPPIGAGTWPTLEQIKGFLAAHGVVYGFDEEAITKMLKTPITREWVSAAKGIPPENGKDAKIEYKVDLNVLKPKKVGENVDMKELGTVINVLQGQEIAEKTVAFAGHEGVSVLGKKIPAYIGKDKNLPSGKGTTVSEDKLHLFADFDGNLRISDGKLSVHPYFEVKGDVDYGVGNIDFVGPVTIHGNVREGFEVRSGSTITIGGVVEGASISSASDMLIKVGIRGGGKAKLTIGGNMTVGYIDQAYVRCEGNIDVNEAVLHSDIGARGEIRALGSKKGQIAGGRIQAGLEVACEVLGSEMGTRTDVTVGVFPEQVEERRRCIEIVRELTERMESINANVGYLKGLQEKGGLTEEKQILLAKITKAKFQIKAQLESSEKRLRELEIELEKNKNEGRVRIRGVCHPGVSISIRGVRYLVREPLRFTRFVYEDGEIKLRSFD